MFTTGVLMSSGTPDLLSAAKAAAQRLERTGFDELDFAESAFDPFLPCMLALEHTERLRVGTAVAISFPRSPMVTAMLGWDLARYGRDRFVLGLGTQVKGHNERRFSVPWSAPAPRMREYVQAMRAAWGTFETGAKPDFAGKHYTFTLMTPHFNPGPNGVGPGGRIGPPVELAAVGPGNAAVAGEVCDGIKLHPLHSPSYLREVLLPAIGRGLARAGRERSSFRVCGGGLVATGPTQAAAERAAEDARRWISFYGSTAVYFGVLEHHGEHDLGPRLREMSLAGRWDEMPKIVPDWLLEELAIIAPYDRLEAAFRERYGGLVDHIAFNEQVLAEPDDEALAMIAAGLHAREPQTEGKR